MPRIAPVDPSKATGRAKELLDAVQRKYGRVANVVAGLANSPAALEAYLKVQEALGSGSLDAKLREQIALVVAQANGCEYCVSAHTAIGKMVGLDDRQVVGARQAATGDARIDAALRFARTVVDRRGWATDEDLAAVRAAGWSDGEMVEILANVVANFFTNYFNHVAGTEVDFPRVEWKQVQSA
ncbi:MAG: carboxymuconolactone decarboxylase family protein [Firmicutes bacterium]|nr:carboxymuconolactone decarboxylase family protein [Bacillota bacterium]